jgi:hypothetical protein
MIGDSMTKDDQALHYKNLIAQTFQQWRPRLAAAPNKNGWDRVFKQSIPSRREILMARDAVLQDILLEAKVLGVKVDVYEREDAYVSPFDKEKAE